MSDEITIERVAKALQSALEKDAVVGGNKYVVAVDDADWVIIDAHVDLLILARVAIEAMSEPAE